MSMTSEENSLYSMDNLGLANGVRLHWNEVRQQHWLLFPEGAIALNPTAEAILTSCNGQRSFEAIVRVLSGQFQDVNTNQVRDLLLRMMQRGLLVNK